MGMKTAARIETIMRAATTTIGDAFRSSGAVFSRVMGRKKNATALEPDDQLAPGAVVGEAIALELALAPEVVAHAHLRPEEVDAEGGEDQQRVDHVDAEERGARAAEDRVARPRRRRRRPRGRWRRRLRRRPRGGARRGCRAGGGGRPHERRAARLWPATHLVERCLVDGNDDTALRALVAGDFREAATGTGVSHSALPAPPRAARLAILA